RDNSAPRLHVVLQFVQTGSLVGRRCLAGGARGISVRSLVWAGDGTHVSRRAGAGIFARGQGGRDVLRVEEDLGVGRADGATDLRCTPRPRIDSVTDHDLPPTAAHGGRRAGTALAPGTSHSSRWVRRT